MTPYYQDLEPVVSATKGRIDNAVRRAFNVFDEWNSITGFVIEHTSYYYEIQSVLEDAVHCGIQAVFDVKKALPSETKEKK